MDRGAAYYNCYYPGPIGLPANVAFELHIDGRFVVLHLVRHLRPVVITDFGNDFTYVVEGEARYLALKRSIPALNTDMLTVDLRTNNGETETIAAYGYAHDYTQVRRQSFSEFTVGTELTSASAPDASPNLLFAALERLIVMYRVVTTDTRVEVPSRLKQDVPVIRETIVRYQPAAIVLQPRERLLRHLPTRFRPRVFSYKEYEKYLPVFQHDEGQMALRIGHHLAIGTEISDAQRTLVDSFEVLVSGGSPRFALIEAVSVGELLTFDFLAQVRSSNPDLNSRLTRVEKKGA